MWNAVTYFETLCNQLIATKTNFKFCRVSGLSQLEDVLTNWTKNKAFMAVDDSDDGTTISTGSGYFNRRTIVVIILKKFNILNMTERETILNECRIIYKSIISRLLKDSQKVEGLMYLDKMRIPYHEVPGQFAGGTCGLYFTITVDEPINLIYNESDWEN